MSGTQPVGSRPTLPEATQPGVTSADAGDAGPAETAADSAISESVFIRACRRQAVERTPVWFMRQAGRALPEYRKLREGVPMLTACTIPEMVAEITLQPVRRYGVDAAVLYSDIVLPLKAIDFGLEIKSGVGPVIEQPIRTEADLARLRVPTPEDLSFITEAVRILTAELGPTPLIGFGGAPFTLASYLIEGGPSRNYEQTKAMMYGAPDLFAKLLDRLADMTAAFLRVQLSAGASAVQLFDSWAGALAPADYRRHVLPASAKALGAVADFGVPRIHFGVGTGELLGLMGTVGADVVGVDWRIPLDEAARRVGPGKALQGNLDPAILFAPWDAVETETRRVLRDAAGLDGHVFNLGHGVLPQTNPDVLTRVVELVHEASPR